jgi:hemerythrin
MNTSMKMFETNAFDLRNLDEEHAEIRRRYEGLDEVILRQGSMHRIHRILAAADNLANLMLLHFTHEGLFLVKFSRYSPLKGHRQSNMKIATQLFDIKAELEQGKVAPVFQLLRLTKVWMKEHVHLENVENTGLIEQENPFWARPAVVDQLNRRQA